MFAFCSPAAIVPLIMKANEKAKKVEEPEKVILDEVVEEEENLDSSEYGFIFETEDGEFAFDEDGTLIDFDDVVL